MERFANRDVCDVSICDYTTKKPIMYIDYANATSTELTGESVYAYGGHGHVKRVTFTGERAGTLTLETQVQTFELYQLITGGTLSDTAQFIKREILTAGSDGLTLSSTPVTDSVNVYAEDDDCGTAIEVSLSGTKVTGTGITSGKKFIVYYVEEKDNVTTVSIGANSFPQNVTIYGETYMTTESGVTIPYKMIAWKAMAQPNAQFGFSNTGDPQTLTITFDLMADTNNEDKILDLIMEE